MMYNDLKIPPPDPQSEEPTVLDLFKSIFKDWDSFFNFLASAFDAARREQLNRSLAQKQEVIVEPAPVEDLEPETAKDFPLGPTATVRAASTPVRDGRTGWRALLGFGVALLAQRVLEPPGRDIAFGIVLYVIALALVLWSYFTDGWQLPTSFPDHERRDPETFRMLPLILATLLAFVAFATFGGNLFRIGNVTIWLLSIAFFVYSLWLPYRRVRRERSAEERRRAIQWGLLVLGVAVIVVFFRVYQIDKVPPEPFSDHAEKILDVYDVSQGETHIFFPRNTGREAFQMYWTLLMSWIFGTGLSFMSLKIGTVLLGLFTLPYMYLLGKEIGGKRVGLFALFFTGVGYWPNVISRVGLRFPLYPLFVAPTLYYLIRGLRTRNRNDFILSGLFLGIGLHGYSPIRILPIVVIVAIGLYIIHTQSVGVRRDAVLWLVVLGMASLIVFTPLLRYTFDNPEVFSYRALSRLEGIEQPLPAPPPQIFFSNLWKGLGMFNWDDGEIWVHSVTHRPALDVVSGALFLIGVVLLLVRYLRRRHWLDLFLLLSIPLLALPSILSLAYPGENPALNRAGGAYVTAFVIVGLALDAIVSGLLRAGGAGIGRGKFRVGFAWGLTLLLMVWSGLQSYDLVFHQYYETFRNGSWNSSEMGAVIKGFEATYGQTGTVWIVPFPHWVDTRLPGVWAGIPNRDFAMWRENLPETVQYSGPKLFMVKANLNLPEANDQETLDVLQELYPNGSLEIHRSEVEGHDFWIYSVPAE